MPGVTHNYMTPHELYNSIVGTIKLFLLSVYMITSLSERNGAGVIATSINYGISPQTITDLNLLTPRLCQNHSVICEGSFCIPGIRKCVCDLRMPVQFGRFCLRQVDIETKCFATNQCNHTIKDAVCIDINTNTILEADASKFKLEQWQQLNEIRQISSNSNESPKHFIGKLAKSPIMFYNGENPDRLMTYQQDHVIVSKVRNSPYEINYSPELLVQNHTRRRTNNSDKSWLDTSTATTSVSQYRDSTDQFATTSKSQESMSTPTSILSTTKSNNTYTVTTSSPIAIRNSVSEGETTTEIFKNNNHLQDLGRSQSNENLVNSIGASIVTPPSQPLDSTSRRKNVKNPTWPPGVCSCPTGYMFDPMVRRCLVLSLNDSHCQVDSDCKKISMSHCSKLTRRCECEEPFVWNQTELACVRAKSQPFTESPRKDNNGVTDNLLSHIFFDKLLPDYTIMLLIFILVMIIGTIIILKLTVKCFSSNNSALISPKQKKKKSTPTLPPKSPYATLRRPDHKATQISNFNQAVRGRILNYDFEQESPKNESGFSQTDDARVGSNQERSGTMRPNKGHKHHNNHQPMVGDPTLPRGGSKAKAKEVVSVDQMMDLDDDKSVKLDSEKSETSVIAIPAPPPTQQPPYMLASSMRGQGSAIAAAAAAVANQRMKMAQKNMEQQSSNGTPVFL